VCECNGKHAGKCLFQDSMLVFLQHACRLVHLCMLVLLFMLVLLCEDLQ